MSVRKGSIAGIGSGPTSNKRASATDINNAEYAAAVAVMSEAKMAEACALLLSEKDYESEQQPGERDNDKLLKIFDECLAASKVVQKRVPAASMPMLHQQRSAGQPNAARTQAIPLKPKLKTMIPPRRGSSGPRPATKRARLLNLPFRRSMSHLHRKIFIAKRAIRRLPLLGVSVVVEVPRELAILLHYSIRKQVLEEGPKHRLLPQCRFLLHSTLSREVNNKEKSNDRSPHKRRNRPKKAATRHLLHRQLEHVNSPHEVREKNSK